MTKIKKNFKMVEIGIMGLIALAFTIFLGTQIYFIFGETITKISLGILSSLLIILIVWLAFQHFIIIYNGTYSQKLQEIWKKMIKGTRNKVFTYLKNNKNRIEISELFQFASIYMQDNEIFVYLLDEIIKLYDVSDIKMKSTISFFLLENEDNNEIAAIFNENILLRNQCKKISEEMCNSIEQGLKDLQEEVNEKKLIIFLQKLLHACLLSNNISKENMINSLNFILGWILKNISKENIDAYQESMLMFILLIPSIKNKLKKNNISDEDIIKSFKKIENSEWFKYLLDKACQYVSFNLCRNEKYLVKNKDWLKYSCITSLYYEKLSEREKIQIFYKVKNMQQELYKEYDIEKVALIVLSTSPIRVAKNDDDLIYSWLSLIYLCISPWDWSFC